MGDFIFWTAIVIIFLLIIIFTAGDFRTKALIIQIVGGIITMLFFGFCVWILG